MSGSGGKKGKNPWVMDLLDLGGFGMAADAGQGFIDGFGEVVLGKQPKEERVAAAREVSFEQQRRDQLRQNESKRRQIEDEQASLLAEGIKNTTKSKSAVGRPYTAESIAQRDFLGL